MKSILITISINWQSKFYSLEPYFKLSNQSIFFFLFFSPLKFNFFLKEWFIRNWCSHLWPWGIHVWSHGKEVSGYFPASKAELIAIRKGVLHVIDRGFLSYFKMTMSELLFMLIARYFFFWIKCIIKFWLKDCFDYILFKTIIFLISEMYNEL